VHSTVVSIWRIVEKSGLLIPLAFFIFMRWVAPFLSPRDFDYDEGVNLMKALLHAKGYALYTEIWSDQPPLLTVLLSQVIHWFGASVVASRVLIVLFSGLLLWSFYQTVRASVSAPAALVATVFLVLSERYIRLSSSVMVGLPALALAMSSIYLLVLAREQWRWWLIVASGFVMALSMQTKLFTAMMIPVMIGYTFLAEYDQREPGRSFGRSFGKCALWLGTLTTVFLAMGFLFHSLNVKQLIEPHFSSQIRMAYADQSNFPFIGQVIMRHLVYLPVAGAGVVWMIRRRKWILFLPLGWLAVTMLFFVYQKPLWYHYVTLLTIPLAWLGAFGVEAWIVALGRSDEVGGFGGLLGLRRTVLVLSALAIGVAMVYYPMPLGVRIYDENFGLRPYYYSSQTVDVLRKDARSKPVWVFTDRPFYAFQAGLLVPPPIAALTHKRIESGAITDDTLLDVLRTYRPAYVVLERFTSLYSQSFMEAVRQQYEQVFNFGYTAFLIPRLPGNDNQVSNGDGDSSVGVLFDDWLALMLPSYPLKMASESGSYLDLRDMLWTRRTGQPGRDLAVSLRLTDATGAVWAQHDEQLGSDWLNLSNRIQISQFLRLFIPQGTPPGTYNLQIVVYDPRTGQTLPATGRQLVVGDQAILGRVEVSRPAEMPAMRHALADFGQIHLVEADTPVTAVSTGDVMPLSLLWQATRDLHGQRLVVVVQLLDDTGQVVASLEEEPLDGRYPTSSWQAQELVRDHHQLTVLPDTPPGPYRLIVGLYRASDRVRLEAKTGFLGLSRHDYASVRVIEVR